MKTLRSIKDANLRDRLRSGDIREEFGVQDYVVRFVRVHRWQWRDHVDRMEPDQIIKWAKPLTKRLPSRPIRRWYECWKCSTSQENPA